MTEAFARFDAFPHRAIEEWRPAFPPGRIERIYLHWSAGDYETAYTAYHAGIALYEGRAYVVESNDLRANMRDVYASNEPYAAHTYRRTRFAAGLAILAMTGARPEDFGAFPLTDATVSALCVVAARLASFYCIPVDPDHVMTHAEAARIDGYYGAGSDDLRWDIARLTPGPLAPSDPRETGAELRRRIRSAL